MTKNSIDGSDERARGPMGRAASRSLAGAFAAPASDVLSDLEVDADAGLSENEARERLAADGPNSIETPSGKGPLRILLAQFNSIVVWLLLAATAVAFATDGPLEAGAILVVLVLNAFIGFVIEWQAGRALDALKKTTVATARVRRGGVESLIDASDVVVGDIVILTAGDRIPADARIIEAAAFRTDESTLTGESAPVEKSSLPVASDALLADRSSMVYLGSNAVAGRAAAVVIATVRDSEIGRIGELIGQAEDRRTPLELRLADLGKRLVYVVLGVAAMVMFAGYVRGDDPLLMAKVSISLAVAAVPEGLPAVTTLILALGVLRMARRSAIVRQLAAVETLGSTTVICSDKTGTLTENRMSVQRFVMPTGEDAVAAEKPAADSAIGRLLRVAVICNEAAPAGEGKDHVGDPTETALLSAAARFGIDAATARMAVSKIFEIPFDSTTKRMTSVVRDLSGRTTAMMKGAPAVVIGACSRYLNQNGRSLVIDAEMHVRLNALNETMAAGGLRVLAFADRSIDGDDVENAIDGDFEFLGFAAMTDPPRPEAKDAVARAQAAGIRIVMLTGDQLETAKAIASDLGIATGNEIHALHARDLKDADPAALLEMAHNADVFARVSPEDKFQIVSVLQKAGEIVAVTGDGVNDAPALKQADIGVAMGLRGTNVAKEAADIVLTDDNFATIVNAIEGGRTIYANIVRFVHLMFSHNLGEILIIFAAILLALPLPLFPLQILWVNLVTDIFPAVALALEPPTADTMHRKPRSPKQALLSAPFMVLIGWQGAMLAGISLGAYYWALQAYGEGEHARTVAVLSLIGVQLGHLFNCRSRRRSAFNGFFTNPYIFAAAAIVAALQLFAVYFDPLRVVLGFVQPTASDWAVIGISVVAPIVIVEVTKLFSRSLTKK